MSSQTIDFHYGKHHAGYVETLNKLIADTDYDRMTLEEIILSSAGKEGLEQKIFNNAGQAWNHAFFWKCIAPGGGRPSSGFMESIERDFGNFDHFLENFKKKAIEHFGSGWIWLVKDADDHLSIETLPNAGNPLVNGESPLLVCDLWEHAYYLDYKNERAKFMDHFCEIINWDFVEKGYRVRTNNTEQLFRAAETPPPPM